MNFRMSAQTKIFNTILFLETKFVQNNFGGIGWFVEFLDYNGKNVV